MGQQAGRAHDGSAVAAAPGGGAGHGAGGGRDAAEKSLIEALTELTATVDDQSGVVSSLHSHVSSLARRPLASEAA